jgi:regulator of sigma E protease
MTFLENFWWLLVLIGVMILIHELGHYWAARFFDVRVETFSFGFGPRLFGFRKGETDFRFSAILFGGYVKMAGEQPGEDGAADPRGFMAKPRWQRLIIAFAGPFMNIILAIGLVTGLFMYQYPKMPSMESPVVGYVAADSAAKRAGLQEGDRIVQIEDKANPTWEDIMMREMSNPGRALHVALDRGGERITTELTPVQDQKTGIGMAGWSAATEIRIANIFADMAAAKAGLQRGDILVSVNGKRVLSTPKLHDEISQAGGGPVDLVYQREGETHEVRVTPQKTTMDGTERWMIGVSLEPKMEITQLSFPDALRESVNRNVKYAGMIYKVLQNIVERRMSPKSIEGPIRIAQLSGDAAREGPAEFIGLMAMVSLNLAIFNLLPIPILDGGVILLLLIEMVMRRDLSLAVKENVIKAGFVFLMAIVMFVLYNDITKILTSG